MKRREFIAALGGAVTIATPITAHAQQAERVRRIGVLMNLLPTIRNQWHG